MKHKSPVVFINYRRKDTGDQAGRLAGDLETHFGKGFAFLDVDDIQGGDKWINALEKAGEQSKIILAMIGPNWTDPEKTGRNRLFEPKDWVRRELESAIAQDKIIMPVLVNGAQLPSSEDLPESLKSIPGNQTLSIRTDEWNRDKLHILNVVSQKTGFKPLDPVKWKRIAISAIVFLSLVCGIGYYLFSSGGFKEVENFCPEFAQEADMKTLLFPFTRSDGTMEDIIQRRFSEMCEKYDVLATFGRANTVEDEYFDQQSAQLKCQECAPDIFLTGLSYENSPGNFGIQADFGFCDPIYKGYGVDEENLEINFDNITFGVLTTDPQVESSIQHVIQIYLGMFLAKKGEFKKSNVVLENVVSEYPLNKKLKTQTYKVIWQNDYRLGNKEKCIQTLEKIHALNPNNTKALTTSSIIAFDQKNYAKAITGFTNVIDKTTQVKAKDKLIEKRGDAYFKNDELKNAKADYKKIESSPQIMHKIEKVDLRIKKNETVISNLMANNTALTGAQNLRLIDLLVENGEREQAILRTRNLNTNVLTNSNLTPLSANTRQLLNRQINN